MNCSRPASGRSRPASGFSRHFSSTNPRKMCPVFASRPSPFPHRKSTATSTSFFGISDDCLDVIVGDVMGKGITAALLGAATKNHLLRALAGLKTSAKVDKLPEPKDIVMLAHA